jgi:hypothetical protein
MEVRNQTSSTIETIFLVLKIVNRIHHSQTDRQNRGHNSKSPEGSTRAQRPCRKLVWWFQANHKNRRHDAAWKTWLTATPPPPHTHTAWPSTFLHLSSRRPGFELLKSGLHERQLLSATSLDSCTTPAPSGLQIRRNTKMFVIITGFELYNLGRRVHNILRNRRPALKI